ncbi:MAG TPA: small basic protein [Tepidisphaeraceae bacterium]|jgi:small basic protein (TIGR04137 family)
MSMDPSLKSASSLVRHRNVLTRGERLERLGTQGKWDESKNVFGLPKVGNRKLVVGGKPKKEEGDAAAAPAGKAAGGKAAGGKAAGGKAAAGKAAPAAKAAAGKAAPGAKGAAKK